MLPLAYRRADAADVAIAAVGAQAGATPIAASVQFLAGGTNIVDFMKLDAWSAATLVDINGLAETHGGIDAAPDSLRLGALVRMSSAADHPDVRRDYPVIAQSLAMAASAQLRNMASLGGNVLQRTRCSYFRSTDYLACNKREPGSGCDALEGVNRKHAVLGVNDLCISAYPGDFAQALMALDAKVETLGSGGARSFAFADLHTGPERPEVETTLAADELITGFVIPAGPHTRRSTYVKVRDRESYAYGLVTAAVALALDGAGAVIDARIALGGVAYRPWRADAAEAWLKGRKLDEATASEAGGLAFVGAVTHGANAFKPELGRRTLARALLQAARMEL